MVQATFSGPALNPRLLATARSNRSRSPSADGVCVVGGGQCDRPGERHQESRGSGLTIETHDATEEAAQHRSADADQDGDDPTAWLPARYGQALEHPDDEPQQEK